MFDRATKLRECQHSLKSLKKRLSYQPLKPSMTTLSDNEQGVVGAEHLRELVLVKSSVNKKYILNDKKFSL